MLDRAPAASGPDPVLLSVVLPNYNHAPYLPRALDALLSPDRPPDEIIVIDDCSADTSREIVTRWAANHPSIRLVANNRNMGVIPTLSRVSAGGFDERLSSFADGYLVRKIALTFGFCYAPTTLLTWCVFSDSVSRTTSTQPDRARQILEKIEARLAADPVFPPWYQHAFRRRWHFATSRLAVLDDPVNRDMLLEMGAQNAADRAVLNYILDTFGRKSARVLILAWLWWRFRPFSLTGLGTTALARLWSKIFQKPFKQ
jgi:glycosyltransferase involved in cell wall biosynthesis